MSADNGIFILDHPRGYAVVHHTLSQMPQDIRDIFHNGETYRGDKLHVFSGKDAYRQASAKADELHRWFFNHDLILEYGICDLRNPDRQYDWTLHQIVRGKAEPIVRRHS